MSVHSIYWTELIAPVAAWRKLWSPLGTSSELLWFINLPESGPNLPDSGPEDSPENSPQFTCSFEKEMHKFQNRGGVTANRIRPAVNGAASSEK